MDRKTKIDFLQAIHSGKLNPNAYQDLPAREFVKISDEQGAPIEIGGDARINLYTKYKDVSTGKLFTDKEIKTIAEPYAACMALNALHLAEPAVFGVGIGKVSLTALSRAQQLEMAFFKISNA